MARLPKGMVQRIEYYYYSQGELVANIYIYILPSDKLRHHNMQSYIAKLYLEDYFNKEEYLTSSRAYFNHILGNLNQ